MTDSEQIASILLSVLSLIFTLARIAIRLRYQKGLAVDDAWVIFAVVCLMAALGLLIACLSYIYTNDPNANIPDLFEQVEWLRKLSTPFLDLTFTSIFAVKFSFLFLFKALIGNVRSIRIYWWTVVVTTTAGWAFGVVVFSLPCLMYGFNYNTCEFGAVLH